VTSLEQKIIDWVISWFEENTNIKSEYIRQNLDKMYFEQGWIDSFKFIVFVNDIEEHFNITFSNEEFQNREFSTIFGLSKIIEGKCHAKE